MAAADLHPAQQAAPTTRNGVAPSRTREILLFLALAVFIWPFIAVGIVSGWGFIVWTYQAFTGPPGSL